MSDTPTRSASAVRNDCRLLSGITDGDQTSLAQAYDRYGAAVYSVARRLCGRVLAHDVVQEVFLALWLMPERFDPTRGSLGGYLSMQAHGRAVDLLRSDGARRAREDADTGGAVREPRTTEASALAALARDELDRALAKLPVREREAIILAYYGGQTYGEVARALDQPEGTIKGRIRNGLRRLATLLPDGDRASTA